MQYEIHFPQCNLKSAFLIAIQRSKSATLNAMQNWLLSIQCKISYSHCNVKSARVKNLPTKTCFQISPITIAIHKLSEVVLKIILAFPEAQ